MVYNFKLVIVILLKSGKKLHQTKLKQMISRKKKHCFVGFDIYCVILLLLYGFVYVMMKCMMFGHKKPEMM